MLALEHRMAPAQPVQVPAPFRAFAVRSDEASHAHLARRPCSQVHVLHAPWWEAAALPGLVTHGRANMPPLGPFDVEYAPTSWAALAAAEPSAQGLPQRIAQALMHTGVLGGEWADCERAMATRVDHLGCRGAGFHNDVARHWPRCLFWLLALSANDVEFVMPHAGVRLPLAEGDLLVFDPAWAHGLCRPANQGQARATSFEAGEQTEQLFLTGELLLSDARWAALGSPWLPLAAHRDALDLRVAIFDEQSGAVQRLSALQNCMVF